MTRPRLMLPFEAEVRFILAAAMLLFIYTVVVGILNGLDLVEFSRPALLAHLHVGTLGWITLTVFAASLAFFGSAEAERSGWVKQLARIAPAVALLYNIEFLTTAGMLRPAVGALMLLVILAFGWWGFMHAGGHVMSVPRLGILAGLATSVIGAVLGVLLGIYIANPTSGITPLVANAHPATMVVGFLVPVGMALSEWAIRPESLEERASLAGRLQILLPFSGGISLLIGTLAGVLPLVMLSLPLEIVGLAIYLARIVPRFGAVSWLAASPARHGVVAVLFLVVNIAILTYLIATYAAKNFEGAPPQLFLALDHSIFVGVLTNTVIAFVLKLSAASRPAWVDHVVFWGVAAGVVLFVGGLLGDSTPLIRVGTPVLGGAILLAIGAHVRGVVRVPSA